MVTKTRSAVGRYYKFGTYETKEDASHAAQVLRKDHSLRAHVKKNRKGKWDTMYAGVKRA